MAKTKPKPEEIQKSFDFYTKKIEEFKKQSLDELKKYYQENQKSIGGMHERALFDVVNTKLQELKDKAIESKIDEIKQKDGISADIDSSSVATEKRLNESQEKEVKESDEGTQKGS